MPVIELKNPAALWTVIVNAVIPALGALVTLALALLGDPSSPTKTPPSPGTITIERPISTPPPAHTTTTPPPVDVSAPAVTFNQGDTIVIGKALCTVAYVNNATHKAYTAGHCLKPGVDPTVYALDANRRYIKIGTARHSQGYTTLGPGAVDAAIIDLETNVTGRNDYTGTPILTPGDVRVGDTACAYGAVTRDVTCSRVIAINGTSSFTTTPNSTTRGDSGGPVWVLDQSGNSRGIAGITSYTLKNISTGQRVSETSTFLASVR